MTGYLLIFGLGFLVAAIAGALAGSLTAWVQLRRLDTTFEPVAIESDRDEFIDSEIDMASVRWAESNGYPPQAAGLMSARLKTLRKIGNEKGWLE